MFQIRFEDGIDRHATLSGQDSMLGLGGAICSGGSLWRPRLLPSSSGAKSKQLTWGRSPGFFWTTPPLQAACKEEDRNASIETNVRTVRPGCIEVDLSIIARTLGDLFADPTTSLATIANGIVVTSGFYGLVKFLGKHGKAVKAENDGGEVSVTAEDGTTTLVNNGVINLYMNCPQATEAVCKSFESLDNDPRVESVSIMSDGEEQFRAERDEFGAIASSPAYESAQTRTTEERVSLTVVKPVLEKSTSRKWEFVWRGEKMRQTSRAKIS